MSVSSQILQASVLGTQAFNAGIKRAPFYDAELQKMLIDRKIGETPEGEASSVDIMKAWTNSWDAANLSRELYIAKSK